MTAERIELLRSAQNGDRLAETKLLEDNQGLLFSIEKRFYNRGVDREDLHQLACIGFIKAVRGFDGRYGTEFSTYAVPKILGEIRRYFRDDGPIKISRQIKEHTARVQWTRSQMETELGREPTINEIAQRINLSVEEIAVCDIAACRIESIDDTPFTEGGNLHEIIAGEEIEEGIVLRESVRHAVSQLPEKLAHIIELRYYRELTQTQIAKIMGISQVQVSRLEKKALMILRSQMD